MADNDKDATKNPLSWGRMNGASRRQGFATAHGSYSLHFDEDGVMHVVVPGLYAVGRRQWVETPHAIVASEERNAKEVLSLAATRIKDAITRDREVVVYVSSWSAEPLRASMRDILEVSESYLREAVRSGVSRARNDTHSPKTQHAREMTQIYLALAEALTAFATATVRKHKGALD